MKSQPEFEGRYGMPAGLCVVRAVSTTPTLGLARIRRPVAFESHG